MEPKLRDTLQRLVPAKARSAQQFAEELAILKRWYYRTHKTGEIMFARSDGDLPMRKIMNAVGRVSRGEKEASLLPEEPPAHPPS